MSLRTDLIPVVDAGRQLAEDLGFRQRSVVVRVRTWDGGRIDSGDATDVDTELSPWPKVSEPPARLVADAPGQYEAGDVIVSKISATYEETDLNPLPTAAVEVIWIVTGLDNVAREYKIVGAPKNLSFGWTVQLRRRNRVRA